MDSGTDPACAYGGSMAWWFFWVLALVTIRYLLDETADLAEMQRGLHLCRESNDELRRELAAAQDEAKAASEDAVALVILHRDGHSPRLMRAVRASEAEKEGEAVQKHMRAVVGPEDEWTVQLVFAESISKMKQGSEGIMFDYNIAF